MTYYLYALPPICTWCGYVQYSRVAYSILAVHYTHFATQDLWQPETEWIYAS